jgi:hypothetical protein
MGSIAQALALEESFEYEKRTYKLAALTFEVIGQWERWLKRRAWADLYATREFTPPSEYAEQSSRLREDMVAGRYDFFSRASLEAQEHGWEGKIEIAALRLAEPPSNELTVEEARKLARRIMEEAAQTWTLLQQKMAEMDTDADPNAERPAETTPPPGASASSPSAPSSPASPGT